MALIEAGSASLRASGEHVNPLSTMATVATLGAAAPEAKLREELRKRAQKVNEFWRSVSGFIESLDLVK
ncbi:hypothetical protein PC129_g7012 [Phytophthora cactorum]|uniref:Uncharacterized protein n=1 Tax=Phytophthora cactorum TaxID=29920 RepID=A0A329RI03_9STRA|nr:hypothetical protein Pcac1_g376 [Phytophthora cactorum]KAG2829114.1 hypothetical protein PC111_g7915 [Phytophthora cactorum]KAG2865718.1 hypothetical protein PC113_g3476 [Phytophthora cactorum]KAG2925149.1 hypothetical protein PC115_g8376 [Phytophthora cactorum]KAG2929763.1 hypothetical protein PC114_g2701 [Phytophthora cactorum]